jgi:hypothetical protein
VHASTILDLIGVTSRSGIASLNNKAGSKRITWPGDARFAFTIFDDPDGQTLEMGQVVYRFLAQAGLRTTKAVWPLEPKERVLDNGITCAHPEYVRWLRALQRQGFEIAFHNATLHTSPRADTIEALEWFEQCFRAPPLSMANHFLCREGVYFGDARLSGWRRGVYNLLTGGKNRRAFTGHVQGHPLFWGDICREKIRYVRNFVYGEINTLKACPLMPYYDADRPFVNYWFAASEGSAVDAFVEMLHEQNIQRLEEEGGACIMYAHLGHGFTTGGSLHPGFRDAIERVARRRGWFVPVSTLLDYLREKRGGHTLSSQDRAELERRWLMHKVRFGSA